MLTVEDVDAALAIYRDALGLEEREAWEAETESGRIAIVAAGAATIELVNEGQASAIDAIEVPGPVRLAFDVGDSAAVAERLTEAGREIIGGPVETPWNDLNVRVRAPDGMQLTLSPFSRTRRDWGYRSGVHFPPP